jgi:aspartokinase
MARGLSNDGKIHQLIGLASLSDCRSAKLPLQVAAKMFEVLSREGANIMMISTSEITISCVIDEKYLELAMRSLHSAFDLDQMQS